MRVLLRTITACLPSIARASSSPFRPLCRMSSNRPSSCSGARPSAEIASATSTRYMLMSAPQHVGEDLEQRLEPVDRVIAHVTDAERLVLQLAVTGCDLEPLLLHCGGDFRTRHAFRTTHRRHGRAAELRRCEDLEAELVAPRPRALRHRAMARETVLQTFLFDVARLLVERIQQRHRRRVRCLILLDVALELEEVEVDAAILLHLRALQDVRLSNGERQAGRQRERFLRS